MKRLNGTRIYNPAGDPGLRIGAGLREWRRDSPNSERCVPYFPAGKNLSPRHVFSRGTERSRTKEPKVSRPDSRLFASFAVIFCAIKPLVRRFSAE